MSRKPTVLSRRLPPLDVLREQSCGVLRSEILSAEAKADRLAENIPEPSRKTGR